MRRLVLTFILPALVLAPATLLLSCDGDPDFAGISGPGSGDLEGVFLLESEFGDAQQNFKCNARGVATLQQALWTLSGSIDQTGECQTPSGARDISGTFRVAPGVIFGDQIGFETPDCLYEGTVVGPVWEPNGASGEVRCTFVQDAEVVEVAGTWLVTFGAASLTISADSIMIPLSEYAGFSVEVLDAAGEPLEREFGFEVSDDSVASVWGQDAMGSCFQYGWEDPSTCFLYGWKLGTTVVTITLRPRYPLEEALVAHAMVKVVPAAPDPGGS
jgi:hypothetical protein